MGMTRLNVISLKEFSDERGQSFSLPWQQLRLIDSIDDLHIASIRPGCTRGNHCHLAKRELIMVAYTDAWSLHWDCGVDTSQMHQSFHGSGAVVIMVPPLWSHAIRNDGSEDVWIVAASDAPYDPECPDVVGRTVTD